MSIEDHAESVAGALGGALIFYSQEEAGAIVVQFNADSEGNAYVIDIDENGRTRSGMIQFETGWEA